MSKIFIIGQNKTGTTSMRKILVNLGFKIPNTQEQELAIVEAFYQGDFEKIKDFISQYDAFKDMPFSSENFYIIADVLFPNSKFVLTIRNRKKWFKSILNFHKKVFGFKYKFQANELFFKDKNVYLKENYVYRNLSRTLIKFDGDLNPGGGLHMNGIKCTQRDIGLINIYIVMRKSSGIFLVGLSNY